MKIIDLDEISYVNYFKVNTQNHQSKIVIYLKGTDDPFYFYDREAKDLWKTFNTYMIQQTRMFTTIGE